MIRHILPYALPMAASLLLMGCQNLEEPVAELTPSQLEEIKKDILLKEAPQPQHPIGAVFEDTIELIGFDVSGPLVAGKEATITWYWRAKKATPKNWKIFVHFDSEARPIRQNLDHYPARNLYTTNRWKAGEIIRDVQTFTVMDSYPDGAARPFIGLYIGETRAKISAAKDKTNDERVIGPTLQVKGVGPAAQGSRAPRYIARHVTGDLGKITVDGKLDEPIWQQLPMMRLMPMRNAPQLDTWARIYYTDDALVIGAYLADTHIWGNLKDRDADTWKEEVLELFIDTNGDGKNYLELQVTPNNVIFDALFKDRLGTGQGTRDEQINRARAWNMEGLETAVHVDGTINDEASPDKAWTIELRLPFASLPGAQAKAPAPGDSWKVNLYRFDRPKPAFTYAYAWSTAPMADFHLTNLYGDLVFANSEGKLPATQLDTAPDGEQLERIQIDPNKIPGLMPRHGKLPPNTDSSPKQLRGPNGEIIELKDAKRLGEGLKKKQLTLPPAPAPAP